MANKRVRLVRSVKIHGKPAHCKPEISPKGSVSPEWVLYKGQRLKIPATGGRWYIRWEDGSKPRWQACHNVSDAIHQQIRKQAELKAVSVGVEVRADDPNRLKLTDALQLYIADQELLRRSKKTLAAHRGNGNRTSPLLRAPHSKAANTSSAGACCREISISPIDPGFGEQTAQAGENACLQQLTSKRYSC